MQKVTSLILLSLSLVSHHVSAVMDATVDTAPVPEAKATTTLSRQTASLETSHNPIYSGQVHTVAAESNVGLSDQSLAKVKIERVTESVENKLLPALFIRDYTSIKVGVTQPLAGAKLQVSLGYQGTGLSDKVAVSDIALQYSASKKVDVYAGYEKAPKMVGLNELIAANIRSKSVDESFSDLQQEVDSRFSLGADIKLAKSAEVSLVAYRTEAENAIVANGGGEFFQADNDIRVEGAAVTASVTLPGGLQTELNFRSESYADERYAEGDSYSVAISGEIEAIASDVRLTVSNIAGECSAACFATEKDDRVSLSSSWDFGEMVSVDVGVEGLLANHHQQSSGYMKVQFLL